jgi:hypothetical protein
MAIDLRFGKEFWMAASLGLVDGVYKASFYGRNTSVGNVEETIMDISELAGQRYPFQTAPENYSISSSDAGDTQQVRIEYLDDNYIFRRIIANLNGQNEVQLGISGMRVLDITNDDATPTAGNVYVFKSLSTLTGGVPDSATAIRAKFTAAAQQSNMAISTVPAGFSM